jgi:hypothetical protein
MGYNPAPATGSPQTPGGVSRKRSEQQAASSQSNRKHSYRYGTITAIRKRGGADNTPFVKVRYEDTGQESKWIPLQDHPLMIAMCYGSSLDDLIGNYRCKIETQTGVTGNGLAVIVADRQVDTLNYEPDVEISGLRIV